MSLIPSFTPGIDINTGILLPSERKEKMMSELKSLDEAWLKKTAIDIPEVVTYEKHKEKVIDPDAIKSSIEQQRENSVEQKIKDMESTAGEKEQSKLDTIESEKVALSKREQNLSDDYGYQKTALNNDMVDQGLARSSISGGAQDELALEYSKAIDDSRLASNAKISALNMEIEVLKAKLQADIDAFKISEAIKVQEKLDSAIAKLEQENEKIREKNAKLVEKEEASKKARADAQRKAEELRVQEAKQDATYGYQGEKKENYTARLDVAKAYYGSIPKEQALKELNEDKEIKSYLGLYYNRLLSYVYGR